MSLCVRIVHDKDLTEDIVQETFLEAKRKEKILESHPNKVGWLYLTARNKMLALSKQSRELIPTDLNNIEESKEDSNYNKLEVKMSLKSVVTDEEYEMIKKYYGEGYKSKELAERYGMSETSFRMKMLWL